jgi:hypothetical protein
MIEMIEMTEMTKTRLFSRLCFYNILWHAYKTGNILTMCRYSYYSFQFLSDLRMSNMLVQAECVRCPWLLA